MTTETENGSIQQHIDACRGWNDGAGLIVPQSVARELQSRGITEGYTVAPPPLPPSGDNE